VSVKSINNQIASVDRDINNIQNQINTLDRSITSKGKEANSYLDRISREKDLKKVISLQKDYHRKQEEIQRIDKDRISKSKSLADKRKKRGELQEQLLREEKSERDKAKKENAEVLRLQERITDELQRQKFHSRNILKPVLIDYEISSPKQYDLFISHASEDKDEFVRPLTEVLTKLGVEIWYDEAEIKFGYSIRKSIDKGLANSRYGLVVLSKVYMTKYWTGQELNGLFAKNVNDSILPIWHKITKDEIMGFSPMLADIKALNTAIYSLEDIAKEILSVVRPPQNTNS
jgi:hypothetical protein